MSDKKLNLKNRRVGVEISRTKQTKQYESIRVQLAIAGDISDKADLDEQTDLLVAECESLLAVEMPAVIKTILDKEFLSED